MKEKNQGMIHEAIPNDIGYIGGVGSELPDLVPKGDWEPWLPLFERQSMDIGPVGTMYDTMNCVQCSRASACEIQAKFYGLELNISDRHWYWLTGCTERGNTYRNCDYYIRYGGGCPEELWAWNEPMTRAEYGKEPPESVKKEALKLLDKWKFGMRVYVPTTIEAMRKALKKGPLWTCNQQHSFVIYRIDDRIRYFDTYKNEGNGRGSYPLSYAKNLVSSYLVPFTPKTLAPKPMIKLPPNCLVAIVDGHGDRLMNVDGTKLYEDDAGKINMELEARNAKPDSEGVMRTQGYPVVHLKTADIEGIQRVNLKGESI